MIRLLIGIKRSSKKTFLIKD